METEPYSDTHWQRAIILVDMNAFFASIEQLDNPKLRGKPVAITNGEQGTAIITCSYEARRYGIKTGMRLQEALHHCPNLIHRPSRPQRYAKISSTIMHALRDITPDIEVFSVDEAFLDVTACQHLLGSPESIARQVKRKVWEASGLLCSVGVSGDKTTAKYAAKLKKPNGLCVIAPQTAKAWLHSVPITELCGIGQGIASFLARYGVHHCGDMEKIPISILSKRFGNLGRRIWYMCQGADPSPVTTAIPQAKSMGHGKVLPPNTKDTNTILIYLLHMSEKLAARLRRHHMQAGVFFIGLRSRQHGWIGDRYRHTLPTDDGATIFNLCQQMLNERWQHQGVWQVQVTALDPNSSEGQLDLFAQENKKVQRLNLARDHINESFGDFAVTPARLLKRTSMPDVIAPAWKPHGHRQSIAKK